MEMREFAGDDLCSARQLVGRGEAVLIVSAPGEANRPTEESRWPRGIAETIGECAVVPLACLNGTEFRRYPLVAGPKRVVRFLCAGAEELPPEPWPYETRPLRTNYREFRELWRPDPQDAQHPLVLGIAERLGQLHSKNILHGDAHIGNWLRDQDGTVLVSDPDPSFLSCPPSPAQCATDVLPLLPSMRSQHWHNFRIGYLAAWPEGRRTIDQIQYSDRTGWAVPFRSGEFATSTGLIEQQLLDESDQVLRVMLLANLALASSSTGDDDAAARTVMTCLNRAEEHCPWAANGLAFVLGLLALRWGDRAAALDATRFTWADPEAVLTRYADRGARLPIINF
ncbi:hypothetical protein ACFV6F_09375 [Kitasatospora phosalacinea]|uniref:hypothetical protein n=1 Tax=Kitasatospora phosalacinea TaxID=2065 RepID=UPI00364AC423